MSDERFANGVSDKRQVPPVETGDGLDVRLKRALQEVFGHQHYKSQLQRKATETVAAGNQDVFICMPTGAGKSLCYQLPAVVGHPPRLTVVVSPLLALITNQVQQLRKLNIPTETFNSSMTKSERERVRADLTSDRPTTRVLYVTPEQMATASFRGILDTLYEKGRLARVVIDEAHCVSQWGHDFRPNYLRLGEVRTKYLSVPWVGLTATASTHVFDDVLSQLRLRDPVAVFRTSSFRRNLFYDVVFKETLEDPYEDLKDFAAGALGDDWESAPAKERSCGIVYCRTRESCEEVASRLTDLGLSSKPYHAKLGPCERLKTQNLWMEGKVPVIVATVSFGMGVDKRTVRFVAHWSVAQSVSGYYQESGRAGRDGLPASCRIYYSRKDRDAIVFLLKQDERKHSNDRGRAAVASKNFQKMISYCEGKICRHASLIREFGDELKSCRKHCDVCSNPKLVDNRVSRFHSTLYTTKKGVGIGSDADYNDLYGGGRRQQKNDTDSYYDEGEEDQEDSDRKAAKALSDLIQSEFERRRGSKKDDRRVLSGRNSRVLEPKCTAISEVSVSTREDYLMKLEDEFKDHFEACGKSGEGLHLTLRMVLNCAADQELAAFKSKGNIHMYRRAIAHLCKDLRDATAKEQLHSLLSTYKPSEPSQSKGYSTTESAASLNSLLKYFQGTKKVIGETSPSHSDAKSLGSQVVEEVSDSEVPNVNSNARNRHLDISFDSNSSAQLHVQDFKVPVALAWDDEYSKPKSTKSDSSMFSSDHYTVSTEGLSSSSGYQTGQQQLVTGEKGNDRGEIKLKKQSPMIQYFFESLAADRIVREKRGVHESSSTAVDTFSEHQTTHKHAMSRVDDEMESNKKKAKSDMTHARKPNHKAGTFKSSAGKPKSEAYIIKLQSAADLVRKFLNPMYYQKRLTKELFKVACRRISHILVQSGSVTDAAAEAAVEKLFLKKAILSSETDIPEF